jgi:Family of unknown function (DUF6088)
MKVSQKIITQLQQIPEGIPFGYDSFKLETDESIAAAKMMERLLQKGVVQRISKGIFYKAKQTIFGQIRPTEKEILQKVIFKNGQRIAYITGIELYQQMGLTTQVPTHIVIASHLRRNPFTIGDMILKPAKSYAPVTDENYQLLGILDAMKDLSQIPDADESSMLSILMNLIRSLNNEDTSELVKYGLFYPPRVRALLGALLETIYADLDLDTLQKSLNPFSKFRIKTNLLLNAYKWQLKIL